jgi:putative ABC transport system permease protein
MGWFRRLRNTARLGRTTRDLDRELAFHVSERIDELRAAGMGAAEAQRVAQQQFGNYTSQMERTRDMDIHGGLEAALRNLRLAGRTIAKAPGFGATVVITLALGIGANAAVWAAIDAVLLRPLPFPDAGRLVNVGQMQPKIPTPLMAPIRLEEWNRQNDTFQAISGSYTQDESETSGELPERLTRAFVAPRFLQVWGISPLIGRDFNEAELKFGGPNVILISDRFWRRRFGGDPNVVGKKVRIGRTSHSIVGVLPAAFRFPNRNVDLWSPSPPDAPYAQGRENTWYYAVGRLRPNVTIAQANANLAMVQAGLAERFPKSDGSIRAVVTPLKESAIAGVSRSLWMLFGSVSLLLLIACTNIAALLLSRAAGRRHEISVRYSLGASRASVAAQLLTEVLVLALVGGGLGILVANAASAVFRSLAKDLPRVEEIGLDWRVVGYTLVCAVGAGLLCGIVPAIRGTRRDLAESMAKAGRSQVAGGSPIQFVLVGVQVSLAVTLLTGAGLLLRSFQELGRISPGFDAERVLTFHISTSWGETTDRKASAERQNRVLDALRTIPGVESAAISIALPGVPGAYPIEMSTPEGRAETEPRMSVEGRAISPDYFALLRIPLIAGELCRPDPQFRHVMVNRSFVNAYWPAGPPIGRRLVQVGGQMSEPVEIRGVVGDARETGLDKPPAPTLYWCGGGWQPGTYFLVRTYGEPAALAETVRRKMRQVEPLRSIYDLSPLTSHISDGYAENRMRTILLTFFAVTAVLLVCVGIYGTFSYLVKLRQREVGLRLALGARRGQILRQFLAQGARVALVGCLGGLLVAAACARLLSGMLYGVAPSDVTTFVLVIGLVLVVSTLASLAPAVRAACVDPMQVLRDE